MNTEPYPDARAVEMAIKTAAQATFVVDSSVSVSERIRQAYFDRLLCRVFSEGPSSQWVLKGGTGMLARVPNARATMDIDLFVNGYTLGQALVRLRALAINSPTPTVFGSPSKCSLERSVSTMSASTS